MPSNRGLANQLAVSRASDSNECMADFSATSESNELMAPPADLHCAASSPRSSFLRLAFGEIEVPGPGIGQWPESSHQMQLHACRVEAKVPAAQSATMAGCRSATSSGMPQLRTPAALVSSPTFATTRGAGGRGSSWLSAGAGQSLKRHTADGREAVGRSDLAWFSS